MMDVLKAVGMSVENIPSDVGLSPSSVQDKLLRTYGIVDLPGELLFEVFLELDVANQHRLRRVSRAWLQDLSTIRLERVVRMDVSWAISSLNPDFQFESFPDLKFKSAKAASDNRLQIFPLYSQLVRSVTGRTKVLQLNWTECFHGYTLFESATVWLILGALVFLVKHVPSVGKGVNVTHLLLDGFSCMDGLHNLALLDEYQERSSVRHISTIAFRRCRFDLIGRFVNFEKKVGPYRDCIFEPLTAECTAWTFIPLRVLRLHQTSKQLEESLARELDQCLEPLPQNLLDKVASKAIQLPTAAQLRWKRELKRAEVIYASLEPENIDLGLVRWEKLRPSTILFFLVFKSLAEEV